MITNLVDICDRVMSIAWMGWCPPKGCQLHYPSFSPDGYQKYSDKLVCLDLKFNFTSGFAADTHAILISSTLANPTGFPNPTGMFTGLKLLSDMVLLASVLP